MVQDVVLYGLCVRSDGLVRGPEAEPGRIPDVEVVVAASQPSNALVPDGVLLAEEIFTEEQWYRFVRTPAGGYLLRYASVCDFVVRADLGHVEVIPVEGTDTDFVSVLACGGLLAFIVLLRGDPLLHASAVEMNGRALAFVGRSGMGKSTMAALCCADGAQLVTDDVLRLRLPAAGAPECYLGAAEVRLRPTSEEVGGHFDDQTTRRVTGDGRLALGPTAATAELLPLAAIVIPLPDRDAEAPIFAALDPVEAVLSLLSFPRIVGWVEDSAQAGQFQHLATIVERIPVYTCRVPWGPPFPSGLGAELLGAMGLTGQSSGPA